MIVRQPRPATRVLGTAVCAGLLLLSAVGVPALASSGIDEICNHPGQPLPTARSAEATPKLTARTETTLDDVLVDDTDDSGTASAKGADKTESASDSAIEAASMRNIKFPHVATSLPGTSDSTLPSFRRQMFRTDI
ncbi:MAG: hypothetical protein WB812_11490 [Woeseiaceae bacterium]